MLNLVIIYKYVDLFLFWRGYAMAMAMVSPTT